MNDPVLLCCCACPDAASAQAIADVLVGERLAACVNAVPGVASTIAGKAESPPTAKCCC